MKRRRINDKAVCVVQAQVSHQGNWIHQVDPLIPFVLCLHHIPCMARIHTALIFLCAVQQTYDISHLNENKPAA